MNKSLVSVFITALVAAGCIQVKTESEIKPIHITMDVNVKVDKQLDKEFAEEKSSRPQGPFKEIKEMMDRQAAGVNNQAMLVPRDKATDDDKILIAEANARRTQRFQTIAKDSGVSLEAVQKRYAGKMREHIPTGSGVWYQDDAGKWLQK